MYSKKVMDKFLHPKFHKELKKFNGKGRVGNLKCGDILEVYIYVENNIIKDISFKTLGCVAAIASSEALCKLAKGKNVDEAYKISDKDIVKELGGILPQIKHHCSVLGSSALKKAIDDYREKNN